VYQVHELRPDQRRPRGQIQVVADQNRLSDRKVRPQSACRVRQHHGVGARRACGAHRMHDMAQVMAFVGVDTADEHQHAAITYPHRDDVAAMPLRGRGSETGQVGHRNHCRRLAQLGGGGRPSGAENDGDVVAVDSGAFANCGCGLLGYRIRIGHSSAA
jgi:hypothetical protein